jgi:hypothetical protein
MVTGGTVPLILIFGNVEERSPLRPDRFDPHPGETADSELVIFLETESLLFLQN